MVIKEIQEVQMIEGKPYAAAWRIPIPYGCGSLAVFYLPLTKLGHDQQSRADLHYQRLGGAIKYVVKGGEYDGWVAYHDVLGGAS